MARQSPFGTWRLWMAANFSTMAQAGRLHHEQAIGDERDEDVRLDPLFELVEDGPDGKIVLVP